MGYFRVQRLSKALDPSMNYSKWSPLSSLLPAATGPFGLSQIAAKSPRSKAINSLPGWEIGEAARSIKPVELLLRDLCFRFSTLPLF